MIYSLDLVLIYFPTLTTFGYATTSEDMRVLHYTQRLSGLVVPVFIRAAVVDVKLVEGLPIILVEGVG